MILRCEFASCNRDESTRKAVSLYQLHTQMTNIYVNIYYVCSVFRWVHAVLCIFANKFIYHFAFVRNWYNGLFAHFNYTCRTAVTFIIHFCCAIIFRSIIHLSGTFRMQRFSLWKSNKPAFVKFMGTFPRTRMNFYKGSAVLFLLPLQHEHFTTRQYFLPYIIYILFCTV